MPDPYGAIGQGLIAAGQSIGQGLAGRGQNQLDLLRMRRQLSLEDRRIDLEERRLANQEAQDAFERSLWDMPETIAEPSGLTGMGPPVGGLQPPPGSIQQGGYVTTGGGLRAQGALAQLREPEVSRQFETELQGRQDAEAWRRLQAELASRERIAGMREGGQQQLDMSSPYLNPETGILDGEILTAVASTVDPNYTVTLNDRIAARDLAKRVGAAYALRYPQYPSIRDHAEQAILQIAGIDTTGGTPRVSFREVAGEIAQAVQEDPRAAAGAAGTAGVGAGLGLAAPLASAAGTIGAAASGLVAPAAVPYALYRGGRAAVETPLGQRAVGAVGGLLQRLPEAVQNLPESIRSAGPGIVQGIRERAQNIFRRPEQVVSELERIDEQIAEAEMRGDDATASQLRQERQRLQQELEGR